MVVKVCWRCGLTKQADDFYKCASKPGGLQSNCKTCRNEMTAERARKNVERFESEGVVVEGRTCSKCKTFKRADAFSISKAAKDGLYPSCKECNTFAWQTIDGTERKKRVRRYKQWARYRITEDQFLAMSSVCEICGSEEDLAIDHDHETELVRGRLCRSCNLGIGFLGDDVQKLQAAILYLGGGE